MTRPAASRRPERRAGWDRAATTEAPRAEAPRTAASRFTYRRRRLAAVLAGLLVLAGLGLGVPLLLYDSGLADVAQVQVTGVPAGATDDVLRAAAVPTGVPLAGVDTAAVAARVATLPAVDHVTVGRDWPHTVVVAVTVRAPVATTVAPGGVALVDAGGVVYPGTPPPGLPGLDVAGAGPGDPSTRSALAALAALPAAVRAQVQTVSATATGDAPPQVAFGLTGGRQVVWGTSDRSADKAAALVPLLTQRGTAYDVTSPDLPTVRR